MRPKPLQLTATTSNQSEQMGPGLKAVMIKNIGSNNVYIDFDKTVDTSLSYLMEAGETVTIEHPFVNFHYQAANGTSAMYVIKILQ